MYCFRQPLLITLALLLLIGIFHSTTQAEPYDLTADATYYGFGDYQTATIFFSAPGDDGIYGTSTSYDIRYSLTPITESNWESAKQAVNEPTPEKAGSVEIFTVYGLDYGTTYHFAIKACDESDNWSSISPGIAVTTARPDEVLIDQMNMTTHQRSGKGSISQVETIVVNQNGEPIQGAIVEAQWEGPHRKRATTTTNYEGIATFKSPPNAAARSYWCLRITNITYGISLYDPYASNLLSVCDDALGADGEEPTGFSLSQNFPNPFNPITEISFKLPEPTRTRLVVYNVRGQQVVELVNQMLPAGEYSFPWLAGDIASGVYFYRLEAGDYGETRKMVLLK